MNTYMVTASAQISKKGHTMAWMIPIKADSAKNAKTKFRKITGHDGTALARKIA